jgi:putative redox protein
MPTTLHADLEQDGPSTSKATVRSHTVYVDRPVARGGADRGPVGGEYLLVALGGCFSSHLLAAIKAREAPVTGVRVAVNGTLDGSPERFTAFDVTVDATCEDPALLRKLVEIAERVCQVVGTLRLSAPLTLTVKAAERAAVEG